MLLNFKVLFDAYNLKVKGALHIGAHHGQESSSYNSLGIKNAIFFEPMKESFEICKSKVKEYNYECFNYALGSKESKLKMYTETANEGQSSSLLKPSLHTIQYPHIVFNGNEEVDVITLDSFMEDKDVTKYNFMNIDVQGYELEVLRGSSKTLESIDCIISEVNREELYENCVRVEELDEYLLQFGFARKETYWAGNTWGDAFYVREK